MVTNKKTSKRVPAAGGVVAATTVSPAAAAAPAVAAAPAPAPKKPPPPDNLVEPTIHTRSRAAAAVASPAVLPAAAAAAATKVAAADMAGAARKTRAAAAAVSSSVAAPAEVAAKKPPEVFDDQYRAKYFSNIPSEDYRVRGRNRVKGGPDLPPNATDEQKAIRKAFTDKTRRLNYAKMKAANTKASPLKNPTIDCDVYSGDQCAHIRLMEIVEKHPLEVGHTFEQKETMMIRIAEEANLRNIKTSIARSCTLRYVVAGENFYVSASNTAQGWQIRAMCCRDHHDNLIIPNKLLFIPEKKICDDCKPYWSRV